MIARASRTSRWVAWLVLLASASSVSQAQAEPNPSCRFVRVATCGGFLEGLVIDKERRLWAMDVTGGRIIEILTDGACMERARTGGNPNGARLLPDGRFLIADWDGLFSFDTKTFELKAIPLTYDGKPVTGLNDLSFDEEGGLYVTVPGKSTVLNPDGRLLYVAPDGSVQLVSDKLAYPNGVAVSADGATVLVSEFAAKRILSLPTATARSGVQMSYVHSNTQGGIGIDGMLLLESGKLIGANFGAREIVAIDSIGKAVAIPLPETAGRFTTNVALDGAMLYVSEAEKGEIWRLSLSDIAACAK